MNVWSGMRVWASVALLVGGLLGPAAEGRSASAQPLRPLVWGDNIPTPKELLDINTATSAQLAALPGMGRAYAARIIAARPYTAKNQLTMRGILPVAAYDQIKPLIIAHRQKT